MPRAKPEGETQAGNPPMRRRPRWQDYSSLKIVGRGPGSLTDPAHPSTPPSHRALGDKQVDPWTKEGGKEGGRYHLGNSKESVDRKTFRTADGLYLPSQTTLRKSVTDSARSL